MEEKAYNWILKHLHSMKSKLPILETFFFYDNMFHSRYYTGVNNQIMKAPHTGFKSLQDCIRESYRKYKKSSELVVQSPQIGFIVTHNKRRPLDIYNLPEIIKDKNIKVPYFQLLPASSYLPLKEYTFTVSFTSGGYVSVVKEAGEELQSHRIFDKARDLVNVIIRTLEFSSSKRLLQLEVDFFENTDGTLWLGRSIHCKVIKETELSHYNIASPHDLTLIKYKTSTCFSKKESLKRNKTRNFTIKNQLEPVKILSPDISDEDNSISKKEESKKRSTVQRNNQETISKHFLEMVCKTNIAYKKRNLDDVSTYETEQEYGRVLKLINSKCSLEDEENCGSPFSNDVVVKQDINRSLKPALPTVSRHYKTPEQASHALINPIRSTTNNSKRRKIQIKSKKPSRRERKAHLVYKELHSARLVPFVSKLHPKKYKRCFKPIRLVKSEKAFGSRQRSHEV